jgi:hypothetical protein
MFAQSPTNGATWYKQGGTTQYTLPIVQSGTPAAAVGQVVWTLPQNTSYINQGCMTLDNRDRPIVATYWAPNVNGTGVTNAAQAVNFSTNNPNRQYMLMYYDGTQWRTSQATNRTSDTAFDGPGGNSGQYVRDLGRPLVMVDSQNRVIVVGRSEDTSMGSFSNANLGLSKNNIVVYYNEDLMNGGSVLNSADWKSAALDSAQMGSYEPTYDSNLWQSSNVLDLFYEPTGLGQTTAPVKVLEWNEQQYFAVLNTINNHIRGDFNFDGVVTNEDIQAMLNALQNPSSFKSAYGLSDADYLALGNFNGDNSVDQADLNGLLSDLTGDASPAPSPVPEPASAWIFLPAALVAGLIGRRTTRRIGNCSPKAREHISR